MEKDANPYSQPDLIEHIWEKLRLEGKDPKILTRADIQYMDEFHLQGAGVSRHLAQLAKLQPGMEVLDVGCGLGGPCRMLADEYGCTMTGLDYTPEYIRAAIALTQAVGLSDSVSFFQGDAREMPFNSEAFDAVWTQHAQMNIKEKGKLYGEIYRVLKRSGIFVYYDIFAAPDGTPIFPVPWAEVPSQSHLMLHEELKNLLEGLGWEQLVEEDHTSKAQEALTDSMDLAQAGKAPSLGLNMLMRERTLEKLGNLKRSLETAQVEVYVGIYTKK